MKNVIIKSLITTFSSLVCFSGGNLLKNESQQNEVHFNLNKTEELAKYNEISSDKLSVKTAKNTTTELSQFYEFNLTTIDNLLTTVRPEYKGIYVTIKDGSYTGNRDDYPSGASTKPEFEAEVYWIDGENITDGIAIIPSNPYYTDRFSMKITSIRSNCLKNASAIKSIFIPDSVDVIYADSFAGIEDTATIECASGANKTNWEAGWNGGATVTYSVEDKNASITNNKRNFSSTATNNNGNNFITGYINDDPQVNINAPLKLIYDVENGSNIETRCDDFDVVSATNCYDAVGSPLAQDSVELSITLRLDKGEKVLDDSLYIVNLYLPTTKTIKDKEGKDKDITIPLVENPLKIKVGNSAKRFYLNDFISIKAESISSLGDYTRFETFIDTVPLVYSEVKPNIYSEYKDKIESKSCVIRVRLTSLFEASYEITYKVGDEIRTKQCKVNSPWPYYNLEKEKENKVGFLIKNSDFDVDLDPNNIIRVDLTGLNITVDIYNYEIKNTINAQCSYTTKFGVSNLYNKEAGEVKMHNLDLALILIVVISILVYAAVSVGLFFFYKNVFKNDEFRRLNPKSFIKKALIYFIGYAFIIASLTSIIFRWGFLNNSIVVYNPTDAFVIIFTIGGLISLGLFIKELVVAIRLSSKRKNDKKLRIGETVEDDGTK